MEKQYHLSKGGAIGVLVVVGIIAWVTLNNIKNSSSPQPPQVPQNSVENQPLEYQLAVINSKKTRPPEDMVNQFKDQLYKLSIVCPKNTEKELADSIVSVYEKIIEKRPVFTLLQISQGFYISIPKTNSSTGTDCKNYLAIYTELILQGN